MIIDTIRNGKSVSIEIKDKRVVGASVDVEQAKQPKITKALKKLGREPKVVNSANPTAQRVGSTKPKDGRDAAPSPYLKGRKGKKSHNHIDLGLAIMQTEEWQAIRRRWEWFQGYERRRFGLRPTLQEIAHLCGCERERIRQLEERALRKLRIAFRFHKDPILRDVVNDLFPK